jgi:hypothetical protein
MTVLAALALMLAACAEEHKALKNPALACQTMECICVEPQPPILDDPEMAVVLWAENGDAYCPEGFELRSATPEESEFLRKHGG